MAQLAAIFLSVAKAVPAAERLLAQLVVLYVAWKTEQNLADEKSKNARNDAAVDAAARELPKLCEGCPIAVYARGQHGATDSASSVQGGGTGGS